MCRDLTEEYIDQNDAVHATHKHHTHPDEGRLYEIQRDMAQSNLYISVFAGTFFIPTAAEEECIVTGIQSGGVYNPLRQEIQFSADRNTALSNALLSVALVQLLVYSSFFEIFISNLSHIWLSEKNSMQSKCLGHNSKIWSINPKVAFPHCISPYGYQK